MRTEISHVSSNIVHEFAMNFYQMENLEEKNRNASLLSNYWEKKK